MPSQSKFLVLEGCNGVGKSTLAEYLCARAGASSFHFPPEFVSFRRNVHLDECVAPLPRLIYYLAATLHLSDLVRAQLTQSDVICDRYLASPLSLMIGESAIEETKARHLTEPFGSYLCTPDLILLTGDYVTTSALYAEPCAAALSALRAPLGRFAVLGNHDYYFSSIEKVRNTITSSPFRTISMQLGTSAKWIYASSMSRIEPFGLFLSAQAMSSFGVVVPVGLLGLQM